MSYYDPYNLPNFTWPSPGTGSPTNTPTYGGGTNPLGGITLNPTFTGTSLKPAGYTQQTDDPMTGGTGNGAPIITDPDEHEGLVRTLETKINRNAGYGPKLRNRKLVSVEDLRFLLDVFDNVGKYYTGYSTTLFQYEVLDQIVNGVAPSVAIANAGGLIVENPYTQEGQDREKEEQKAQAAAKNNNWLLLVGAAIVLVYASKS